MRILTFFLNAALFGALVGVFIYFLGGTLWLQVGTYEFRREVESLPRFTRNIADYVQMCQNSPKASEDSSPVGFQIRFIDDREYVVELVCSLIENSPIELKRGQLPPLITKMPGSSGFYYQVTQADVYATAVRLFSINKEIGISLSGDEVKMGQDIMPLVGTYPKAECQGFGYSCCVSGSQVGQGDQLGNLVTDCAATCFPICATVPFVGLFNSDPPYDTQTRTIVMAGDTLDVLFNYNIGPKDVTKVRIDFGDGVTQDSEFGEGIFTHTYSCSGPCRYMVKISAVDAKGVSSVETDESKIYIVRE